MEDSSKVGFCTSLNVCACDVKITVEFLLITLVYGIHSTDGRHFVKF